MFRRAILGWAAIIGIAVLNTSVWTEAQAQDQPPRFGQMAQFKPAMPRSTLPDLTFVDGSGAERRLSDFRGRVVLLNLWATWCPPCVKEMPSLQRVQAQLGGPGFIVLALSQDRAGLTVVERFYRERDLTGLDIFVDRTMASARALEARGLPTTLIVDTEGREAGRLVGSADWDAPEALALIEWYLGGRGGRAPTTNRASLD